MSRKADHSDLSDKEWQIIKLLIELPKLETHRLFQSVEELKEILERLLNQGETLSHTLKSGQMPPASKH